MNSTPSYHEVSTVFKTWDPSTREGIIHTYLLADPEQGFELFMKYMKEEKLLGFFKVEDMGGNLKLADRIQPWRLIKQLINTKTSPVVRPKVVPAIEKLKAKVPEPCPNIFLTALEKDVMIYGIYNNAANEIGDPWDQESLLIRVPSSTIADSCKMAAKKKVPTVMASLTKKGLITCIGVYGSKANPRTCIVSRNGALVMRRELTGA